MGDTHRTEDPDGTEPSDASSGRRKPSGVYKRGKTVWRISESVEGGLKVEVLTDGTWVSGPVNLVGLRLDSATTKLNQESIDALPA